MHRFERARVWGFGSELVLAVSGGEHGFLHPLAWYPASVGVTANSTGLDSYRV